MFVLLLFALQAASPAPPARRAAPANVTVEVHVVDRAGTPAPDVHVTAEGPVSRAGLSDVEGQAPLRGLTPGTYRLRAEGEGFVTLEKEVAVRAGAPTTVDMALTAAPPPPPPPQPQPTPSPAPVAPASPRIEPGQMVVQSLPDLAERSLGGRDTAKMVPIGCSGLSRAQLLIVRDNQTPAARPDVDEALYLIAGEATLTMDGKDRPLTPGWFALVPRGTPFSVARKGRNPPIVLSIVAGLPCDASSGGQR